MENELLPRKERMERRARGKKARKRIYGFFACFVGICVILWTVGTMERVLNWHGMDLVAVKHGVLEDTVDKKAVVLRREVVLSVPGSKSVKYLVEEGTRVQAGAMLLKVQSPEINRTSQDSYYKLYSPFAGVVSKKADGFESVLTPSGIKSLNLKLVYDKVCKGTMEGKEKKGEAVVRIVDNLSPAYLCFPSSGLSLKKGAGVLFRIPGSQELFSGIVSQVDGSTMLAEIVPVPNELLTDRVCNIELVTRREEGIVVPVSSLVRKNNISGLYAVSSGEIRWIEVKVKGIFKEKAVVTGVNLGQEIVSNPETI